MVHYLKGNLFESDAEALVNAVNTVGVMGKGIALQFKNLFPHNYKVYANACKDGTLVPGKLLVVTEVSEALGKKTIVNFPTKLHWRNPSEYTYVESGLQELAKAIKEHGIKSIAMPALGAGLGGLDWDKVKTLIEQYLGNALCEVHVYLPLEGKREHLSSI